ncbi:type II toxin-antitoxin system HicA family toxin [Cytophagales bacterium LB-30]|uniref:Type II toxin-antitoxin system HicA family toxin n=1 Tax=Shiella aurantiaca TaxID=3058365 RepID=A0ABT8F1L3_9BACT|nr:type II toxin-antitoxin system HicA family toxin [Shiella aurantiaca]MDN4164273.1 type II toxin-antitoxin system HicA family toxin [Shiella aurantiaca]
MAKCSEILRMLKRDGWYIERQGKGSHLVLKHPIKHGVIIFPNHGSAEMAKGTEKSILKAAGLM